MCASDKQMGPGLKSMKEIAFSAPNPNIQPTQWNVIPMFSMAGLKDMCKCVSNRYHQVHKNRGGLKSRSGITLTSLRSVRCIQDQSSLWMPPQSPRALCREKCFQRISECPLPPRLVLPPFPPALARPSPPPFIPLSFFTLPGLRFLPAPPCLGPVSSTPPLPFLPPLTLSPDPTPLPSSTDAGPPPDPFKPGLHKQASTTTTKRTKQSQADQAEPPMASPKKAQTRYDFKKKKKIVLVHLIFFLEIKHFF
ncbi:hypothetical protein BSKO_01905 [Bryopsis sp. KO-2023]|nr:hypothetical protein BSKO_01905 [Bryopsis sp. KO-2023]